MQYQNGPRGSMAGQPSFRRVCPTRLAVAMALAGLASPGFTAEIELPEVRVTAREFLDTPTAAGSRLGLTVQDTPASIDLVDSEAMIQRGDYAVRDAVIRTTGITDVSAPGNGMAYTARGFSGVNSVAVTENGQRVFVGSGTSTHPASTWGYERFEVLRGVGSIVNGTGTAGATINAVRKEPNKNTSLEAMSAVGEGGTERFGIGGTGAIGSAGAFRLDAYTDSSDGFIDRGDSSSKKFMSSFRFDVSDTVRLDFQADVADQKPQRYFGTPLIGGATGRLDTSIRERNYNVGDAKIQYSDSRALARATWQATPELSVRYELSAFDTKREWRNVESYSATATQVSRNSYLNIQHDQSQLNNRLEATHKLAGNQLIVGWEFSEIDFKNTSNSGNTATSVVPLRSFDPGVFISTTPLLTRLDSHTLAQAFYIDDAYDLTDRLKLLAGLRRDTYRYSRTNPTNPADVGRNELDSNSVRLGLSYRVTPDTNAYVQASTGSDPIDSLLSASLANMSFKLTSVKQAEVGVKQKLSQGLGEWTAAVYRIEKDDILTRDPSNSSITIQGGSQSSQGIELGGNIKPARNWRIDGNVAFVDAQYDKFDEVVANVLTTRNGNRPTNIPKVTANLWATYGTSAWETGAGARYVGERFSNNANTTTLPSYVVYDAMLAYRVNRNLTLRGLLRNLGDKVYATTSGNSGSQWYLGEPRRAEVVAELRF